MLVTPAQLAEMLRVDSTDPGLEYALQSAQAEVEGIMGYPVAERTLTWKHTLTWQESRLGWVELPDGPVTGLVTVTLDGLNFLPKCTVKANGYLSWQDADLDSPPSGKLEVTYRTGWTSANVPEAVRNAILHLGAKWYARPDPTITSQSFGGGSTGYASELPRPMLYMLLRHTKLKGAA